MVRYLGWILVLAACVCSSAVGALAQEEVPPEPAPVPLAGDLLAPGLARVLINMWGPVDPGQPTVFDGENVTILSVPDDCAVYMASRTEIENTTTGGQQATVESVVFTDSHFVGNTPLTVTVPPGSHVLAIRTTHRADGFDGGCVAKTTHDVITGGRRHAYHLYPLHKKPGQYQCFVANFTNLAEKPSEAVYDQAERGTFRIPVELLMTRLANGSRVPADDRERVARMLNQLGVAQYDAGGTELLIKLTLLGNDYELLEWPVTK